MARYLGQSWTKRELRRYLSDPAQLAGITPALLTDGKAEGVRTLNVRTGSGLEFTVLPGRAMDVPQCWYNGVALHFASATGITHPGYYEEPGLRWLRTFFGGLLATCGITYSGAPSVDQGESFGLHGRIGNAGAENVAVSEEWEGDEYLLSVRGRMREASVMGENLTLTRSITTRLGAKSFRLEDVIENRGFEPQPLMMLYHFNFGFPLLSEDATVVAPITATEPRDPQAAADNGVEECLGFLPPTAGYKEKVFFHTLAADGSGRTFVALVNRNPGGKPLGIVLRYRKSQLPQLTEWKMMGEGCYVVGLEPGTVNPIGRAAARERGMLPMIEPQQRYPVEVDFEVLDSDEELQQIEAEAKELR